MPRKDDNNEGSVPTPPLPKKDQETGADWPRTARQEEFDRFKDLTRRLVTIPKKQLDEKRRKES